MFYVLLQVLITITVTSANVQIPTILLNDGNRIPVLAFGTVDKPDALEKVVKPAVIQAIESGFRQIDSFANEKQIGEAISDVIKRGIVTREELWITIKLHPSVGTRERVLTELKKSLKKLKLDYVDLFLIIAPENMLNVPVYDMLNVWKGMEDVKKLNLTRSIGVSNFNSSHINRILTNSETVPSVNEIEVNPFYTNLDLVAYCQSQNITVLSYAPFGFIIPRPFVVNPPKMTFEDSLLKEIAQKYGKTASQIVLRYLIDRGTVPIPKSTNIKHILSNLDVFDFRLTPKEIYSINQLNQDAKVFSFDRETYDAFYKYYNF